MDLTADFSEFNTDRKGDNLAVSQEDFGAARQRLNKHTEIANASAVAFKVFADHLPQAVLFPTATPYVPISNSSSPVVVIHERPSLLYDILLWDALLRPRPCYGAPYYHPPVLPPPPSGQLPDSSKNAKVKGEALAILVVIAVAASFFIAIGMTIHNTAQHYIRYARHAKSHNGVEQAARVLDKKATVVAQKMRAISSRMKKRMQAVFIFKACRNFACLTGAMAVISGIGALILASKTAALAVTVCTILSAACPPLLCAFLALGLIALTFYAVNKYLKTQQELHDTDDAQAGLNALQGTTEQLFAVVVEPSAPPPPEGF